MKGYEAGGCQGNVKLPYFCMNNKNQKSESNRLKVPDKIPTVNEAKNNYFLVQEGSEVIR